MLSFLIEKCGAAASDLPQLVKLSHLFLEEEEKAAVTSPLPTRPAVDVVSHGNSTNHVQAVDNTMLGFLLDKCATAEEQVQCPVLQQMRGWLQESDETPEEAATEAKLGVSTVTAHVAGKETAQLVENGAAHSNTVAESINHHDGTPAPEKAASRTPAAAAVVAEIPTPILPGVGDWKGTITVYASPPPDLPPPQSTENKNTATLPVQPEASVTTATDQAKRAHDEVSAAVTTSHTAPTPPASSTGSQPQHPHVPSYAGRMPCPASEALAVRNSATVRLLSGIGITRAAASRPTSSLPPASRPMSGFAKRFISSLYDRVSAPRDCVRESASVPLSKASAFVYPIGSGVRAVREHQWHQQQQQQQQSLSDGQPTSRVPAGIEAWRLGVRERQHDSIGLRAGAADGISSVHDNSNHAHASRFTPAPPSERRVSGSEPRQRRPWLTRPAAAGRSPSNILPSMGGTASAAVAGALRPARRPASAIREQQPGPVPGCADPVGLMVVGARIRLPSTGALRTRYA
jgi:hypothetical protein